jgi:glycosyltransferase involved in cell wall biosynthesis
MNNRVTKKIAVVIPCHNEAASIVKVIKKFPRTKLKKGSFELSIYVVDNNSNDNTARLAEKAGANVIHEPRKGKGYALRAGFAALPDDIDYVVMLDGDDTYSPEEITRVVEPLHSNFCDAVIGSRLGGHIQASAMTTFNRLGNWLFTSAVRTVYRANVTDVLTGYFAWRKEALDQLYPHLKSDGFAIEMEMVTKMARLGHRLTSVPISYHPRDGESHLHPVKDGLRILRMFIKNLTWQKTESRSRTPKIVFVSDSIYPYMIGGKEKRLHEISKRLAGMGYDVHIYTMHWWKDPNKTRIENGVTLHALSQLHEMYKGDRRSIKEGILFGLACFKLFRVRFDVLDVDHMPFFPILSSWVVCMTRRRTFYGTWHEALSTQDWKNYMGLSGYIAAIIERISVRLPHTIIAASPQTKELLQTIHGRNRRVGMIGSGIDTDLMRSIQPINKRCDVLYAGRLVKDKNIDVLLKAMQRIVADNPEVKCTIIGKGTEKSRLKKQAAQLGLKKNVTFIAPLADAADLYAYMKSAKVFCSPSTREGFGIVSLEALGCGTPVITIDSPANAARHLIRDGQNGSIIPLKPDALADAIEHWIAAAQKTDIALQASQHGWDRLAQKQAEVYAL